MFTIEKFKGNPQEDYQRLHKQIHSMTRGINSSLANMANASALIYHSLPELNWAGFYLNNPEGTKLTLGPFQGLPACVEIPLGKGVCGAAAASHKTQRIEDVHQFPGHIACDAASQSELVIPLVLQGRVFALLDLDSPRKGRFTPEDQEGLEEFCRILVNNMTEGDLYDFLGIS